MCSSYRCAPDIADSSFCRYEKSMRFLDTQTGEFVELDSRKTRFAILSHTWDEGGEQSYKELKRIQKRYDLKAQCPQHGTENSQCPSPSPPERLPDACPSAMQGCSEELAAGPPVTSVLHTGEKAQPRYHTRSAKEIIGKDRPVATRAQGSRFRRSMRRIWRTMLRIIHPGCLEPAPFSDVPQSSTAPNDFRPPSHPPVVDVFPPPSQDVCLETVKCCIWGDNELSVKIREACRVAREAGYEYLWIDSCCIDKSSSSELSEAINSMYQWYGHARICYAYLADVHSSADWTAAFRSSRWFRRGWTLQELIAPFAVTFLSADWRAIGSKHALVDIVEEITGIPGDALLHEASLDEFSVAQRLSWAAPRETTRVEDRAYSLPGIFDISMPTLYGEGKRAFLRLQEVIIQRIPDQSIFAWEHVYLDVDAREDLAACVPLRSATELTCEAEESNSKSLFASGPELFSLGGRIRAISHDDILRRLSFSQVITMQYISTPHGIQTRMPMIPLPLCLLRHTAQDRPDRAPRWYLAILGCEHDDYPGSLLGRVISISPSAPGLEYLQCGYMRISPEPPYSTHECSYWPELFPLSPVTIERCCEAIELKTVYISYPERDILPPHLDHLRQPHDAIYFLLRRRTRDTLRASGYVVGLRCPDEEHPTTHRLTLSSDHLTITIEYKHAHQIHADGQWLTIEARVKMSYSHSPTAEIATHPGSVNWWDCTRSRSWNLSLDVKEVTATYAETTLTVKLGLELAALSYYYVHVEVSAKT